MKFAFVFPGQGSQSVGMLNDLSASYPIVKHTYEQASEVLKQDLWKLVVDGPAEELNQTMNTQPAMLAASYACWQVFTGATEERAQIAAGHSFGEVSALTCAGAIGFEDAVLLARKRGELMQSAVPDGVGAMAAILGLDDESIENLCKQVHANDKVIEAVNYNAPGQVVVAGHSTAIDEFVDLAKEQGAKRALKLPVSVPAHSSLMRAAADQFAEVLTAIDMQLPEMTVLQNATLASPDSVESLKAALQAQLYSPVRWVDTINQVGEFEVECVFELGPGKVLTGLNKRINKGIKSAGIFDNASLEAALQLI